MGYDAFAPISPARINARIVPAGRVKTSRFNAFVARLQEHCVVPLDAPGKISEQNVDSRLGTVVYDLSPSQEGHPSLEAFPFDLNREPQVVLALADGNEPSVKQEEDFPYNESSAYQTLLLGFERLQGDSSSMSTHFLLVFDAPAKIETTSDKIFLIPPHNDGDGPTKTAMVALTGMVLAQWAELVRDLEASSINSPRLVRRNKQDPLGSGPGPGNSNQSPHAANMRQSTLVTKVAASGEKQATSSKARFQIVLGSFYLQAGRWLDALQELSNGAIAARSSGDYLWHGKALEYLLVCMLMLRWAGIHFEIPQICRPATEKGLLSRSAQITPTTSTPNLIEGSPTPHQEPTAVLQDLAQLVPSLTSTVMTLYTRASSFTQDKLPQTMMSEARIRLANLLAFLYLDNPSLDSSALSSLVLGVGPEQYRTGIRFAIPRTRKSDIARLLIEAATDLQGEISNNDFVYLLTGIVSGLSGLGLDRKQAFYAKELLQKLIPCLVEARKIGAAEMGIHPAAGLSLMSGSTPEMIPNLRRGITSLLDMVGNLYGIPAARDTCGTADVQSDLELIKQRLVEWVFGQSDGDTSLKMESLRLCINVCEALPDLAVSLRFSVQLLQTARRTITLSNHSINETPFISTEEQGRLINSIKRTVNAAPKIGLPDIRADYWDDFLVRGIQLLDAQSTAKLIPHTSQDLALAVGDKHFGNKDPFIYNPFTKEKADTETVPALVAGEVAHFGVCFQNPFDFDVEIDNISLLTEGCAFEAQSNSIVLGRFRTQNFVLSGIPQSSGSLRVLGCRATVRNCNERSFYIFSKEWQPPKPTKFKRSGRMIGAPTNDTQQPESTPSSIDLKSINGFLQPDVLSITVIQPQPYITVVSTNLAQPSLMLLEGEKKEFQITLQNDSKTATADLLLFTFEDQVTTQLQTALENRELGPAELYEVQFQLVTNPSVRWKNVTEDGEQQIPVNSQRTFTFEAFGNPGLTSAVVHINYAQLGVPLSEVKEKFYTRQISFVVAITVNASVDIHRFNLLPLSDSFAWSQDHAHLSIGDTAELQRGALHGDRTQEVDNQFDSQLSNLRLYGRNGAVCLGVVDFRNVWPHPISISVVVGKCAANQDEKTSQVRQHTTSEILQPGHVSRLVLVLPKIFIPEPSAPIPAIGNQRQFILSASKPSMEAESAYREAFWYREELLKYIHGSWKELDTGRNGIIDFRKALRLNARMIDCVRVDDVEIDFLVKPFHDESSNINDEDENCIQQVGKSQFILHTETFASLVIRIHNRTKQRLKLLLRLQPSLRNQPHNIALDLSKRLAWSGVLQRALRPALEPGEVREAELGITALVEGYFEIGATVEEIQGRRPNAKSKVENSASTERRIWQAREPCLIDAMEAKIADR
jgi:trafficking protein particle complex subunit 9